MVVEGVESELDAVLESCLDATRVEMLAFLMWSELSGSTTSHLLFVFFPQITTLIFVLALHYSLSYTVDHSAVAFDHHANHSCIRESRFFYDMSSFTTALSMKRPVCRREGGATCC